MLPIDFLRGGDDDLQEAFNRFENYREGFGGEFLVAVEVSLMLIASFPKIAPPFLGRIRRQILKGFPYGIFYEVQPGRILVFAVLDLRQREKTILRRLRI